MNSCSELLADRLVKGCFEKGGRGVGEMVERRERESALTTGNTQELRCSSGNAGDVVMLGELAQFVVELVDPVPALAQHQRSTPSRSIYGVDHGTLTRQRHTI
eukprot:1575657-Rhodomonas_salina.3